MQVRQVHADRCGHTEELVGIVCDTDQAGKERIAIFRPVDVARGDPADIAHIIGNDAGEIARARNFHCELFAVIGNKPHCTFGHRSRGEYAIRCRHNHTLDQPRFLRHRRDDLARHNWLRGRQQQCFRPFGERHTDQFRDLTACSLAENIAAISQPAKAGQRRLPLLRTQLCVEQTQPHRATIGKGRGQCLKPIDLRNPAGLRIHRVPCCPIIIGRHRNAGNRERQRSQDDAQFHFLSWLEIDLAVALP